MSKEDIKTLVTGVTFVFGIFLLAMCYHLFLLPNEFITGGTNGIAIIFNKLFNIDPTVFFFILCIALLQYINISQVLISVVITGFLYGASSALIYKSGFTTGGGDVIMELIKKYAKVSTSVANFSYSFIILLMGAFVFGFESFIYSIIILLISNHFIDKITLGVSLSKVFFIYTNKLSEVKKVITEEYDSGVTILQSKQEFLHKKGEILMVAVSNLDCYRLRNRILELDPNAFFVINDCYEVNGGKKKERILINRWKKY